MVGRWSPSLLPLLRDINEVTEDPQNARGHSERNVAAIADSLRDYGQQKPIVVRDGVAVAGSGTLRAARQLGWTHLAVVETDLGVDDARDYAIADNRTAELATWVPVAVEANVTASVHAWEAKHIEWLPTRIGFTEEELTKLLRPAREAFAAGQAAQAADLAQAAADVAKAAAKDVSPGTGECVLVVSCDSEADRDALADELRERGFGCRKKE